jgi:hypothetical protein
MFLAMMKLTCFFFFLSDVVRLFGELEMGNWNNGNGRKMK